MCYFFTEKTFIHEVEDKYGLESELEIYLEFFTDWYYKGTWRLEKNWKFKFKDF